MTVNELCNQLELNILADNGGLNQFVTGCYTGDLLSWVMARLPEGAAWLTVMGNINAIAVASLKDAACIILTDSAPLDDDALRKAQQLNLAVLSSEQDSYSLGARIAAILK
mgnify:CR=1 FL=1